MACKNTFCFGVFLVGMVALGAEVEAGPREGDSVTPMSAEVVKRVGLRDGIQIHDIREDLGEINRIRVGAQQGRVAGVGPLAPVWDSPFTGYIFGGGEIRPDCFGEVDLFSATVGWGDQWNFGNGRGASGTGGAEIAQYKAVWCAGYNEYFNGPNVCNTIAGDDTSCPLFGTEPCIDCYDGSAPYTVTTGIYMSDACGPGPRTLIDGTEVTFQSSDHWGGGQHCTEATIELPVKTYVPDGSYYMIRIGLKDTWFPLGYATTVGDPGRHLYWFNSGDSGDCINTFSCFAGSAWSSIGAPWVASSADATAAYTLSLLPVSVDDISANGGDTTGVSGNTITVDSGGHRLVLEFWWSDWSTVSPGDPDPAEDIAIQAFQTNLNSSGFTSAYRGTITYSDIACSTDADCWGGGKCGIEGSWFGKCEPGYMDESRSDFIFKGSQNDIVAETDFSTPNLRFGAALQSAPITSPRAPTYAATVLTEISADALGTFTIWPRMHSEVGLLGGVGTAWEGTMLPLIGMVPAKVRVVDMVPCCQSDFTCSLLTPAQCMATGFEVSSCEGDGDGLDDCAPAIPAVSTWGLIVLALLALVGGSLVLTRRRAYG